MNCDEALLAISAALDGELSPGEQARLSEHLLACPDCRELAEDLRVLNDLLEDSGREPPAELAASVQRAVAAEAQMSPVPKKKRAPPYLRAMAAMLALCVCLGGIGLVVTRMSGTKGADADSVGMAPALFQSEPEAMEKARDCPNGSAGSDGAAEAGAAPSMESSGWGYSSGGGGPSSEGASIPYSVPEPAPNPNSLEDGQMDEVSPSESEMSPGAAAVPQEKDNGLAAGIAPEEALELVFEYLGGYESYPDAKALTNDGQASAYCLKTVETNSSRTDYCLSYQGQYSDSQSSWFRLYEAVSDKREGYPDYEVDVNWFLVSPEGEITTQVSGLSTDGT